MDVWASHWSAGVLRVAGGQGSGKGGSHAPETVLGRIIMGCRAAGACTCTWVSMNICVCMQ